MLKMRNTSWQFISKIHTLHPLLTLFVIVGIGLLSIAVCRSGISMLRYNETLGIGDLLIFWTGSGEYDELTCTFIHPSINS
jgi:hypothetical protein